MKYQPKPSVSVDAFMLQTRTTLTVMLHGQEKTYTGNQGDYLVVSPQGHFSIVSREEFDKKYQATSDPVVSPPFQAWPNTPWQDPALIGPRWEIPRRPTRPTITCSVEKGLNGY